MIIRLSGGLGNQLFQYALGRTISKKYGKTVVLDVSAYYKNLPDHRQYELLDYNLSDAEVIRYRNGWMDFLIRLGKISKIFPNIAEKFWGIHLESSIFGFESIDQLVNYKILQGYWQNVKYFEEIRGELLNDLKYTGNISRIMPIVSKIRECQSVAIHIRRTDYLNGGTAKFFEHPTLKYYECAMDYIRKYVPDAKVFFFSDDIKWCKKAFANCEDAFFVDEEISGNSHYDLELMRNCKHFITANSTFSWWGAWLCENESKILISPYNWVSDPSKSNAVREAILKDFVLIDNDGLVR